EKLTMIGPTIEALRGLMAGIISNTPVYLMAVTGVGKNAMLRYLANLTGTPLYRINFGKETDEAQLYGHFEVEVFINEKGEKKKRIVIQDGKMIEAIKNGGWCLWDEANLASEAFLVAQNDVVQQLRSGKVRVRQGGKIVEIPVHPNFRQFAAGNPEGYGGRKPTEKSFGSRWLKVAVREFRVEEQQAILNEEFADSLSEESADHIPQVLHALKIAAGGEVVTLRTLKRVARRIAESESPPFEKGGQGGFEGRGPSIWTRDEQGQPQLTQAGMLAFAQAMEAEVLDGLSGERYQNAVEALEKALARGEQKVAEYLGQSLEEDEFFEEIQAYQRVVRSNQKKEVTECSNWEDLVPVATTLKYAAKVLDSLRRGDNVLLEGPPAVSKSSIPKWLGKLLGQDVVEATGSPDHSSAEMVGMPTIDELGNLVFQQGYILKALREGSILILNEANLIPPEVLERLNSLLDDDKMLMVTENGAKVPVKADPNFRIIFTQNPAEMQGGRKAHSPALENKFRKIFIRDTFSKAELERIVAHELAKRLGTKVPPPTPPRGKPETGPKPPEEPPVEIPLAAMPATIPTGMSGGLTLSASSSAPSFTMAAVRRSLASVFDRKKRKKAENEKVDPRDLADAEQVATEATKKIQQEIEAAIQTFMREQGRTLENLGSLAAMRRVRVEVDTSGKVDIAAMDLDRGVMLVNPLAALELSPRQIAAVAIHEGGHGAISRIGDGFFYEKKSRHLLNNCLEDPRVNDYMTGRLPGSRSDFISLYEKFFPDPQKIQKAKEEGETEPLGALPHEEFAHGFIDLWANGRVTEHVQNPKVREALERLAPVARKIWATRPDPYHPREREVIAKQNEVFELIKKHILPDYEKLYQESLEQLKEELKQRGGRGRPGGPGQAGGQQGGGRSSIDEDDLDEEAKKLLEERAGELAERLEPQNTSPQRQREIDRARRRGQNEDPKGKGKGAYQEKDFRPYDQKTFADLLKERAGRKKDTEAFYDKHPHRRYFDPIRKVAQEVGEILKQVLHLNADYEHQGPYISGTKLDVRRAVQSILHDELGILSEEDLKLFLRKKYPTRRSHGFILLLDESGSMKDEKAQAAALQAMALFQYVMEQLRTDYAVAGFHDTADIHKAFEETIRGEKQQDAFMQELESSGGGGTNDLEGLKLSDNLFQGRDNDEKTVIVVTDGQGVAETAAYVKEMESRGITVIAIGIGPGTEKVGEVYKNFYHSHDFRDLPKTLLRILVKRLI
ncbi:MAG TPA: AAA family ATPase, partial [bacterium]|nr:AAA family ATPase [bacterium]